MEIYCFTLRRIPCTFFYLLPLDVRTLMSRISAVNEVLGVGSLNKLRLAIKEHFARFQYPYQTQHVTM
jgi:hypothetical protein